MFSVSVMATSVGRANDVRAARRRGFGDEVRAQRKAQGLSQERLADLAGMHRTYIGSVERGERNVSLDSIYALANALRVHVSELFPRSRKSRGSARSKIARILLAPSSRRSIAGP